MKRDAGWMTAIVAVTATLGLSSFRSQPASDAVSAPRFSASAPATSAAAKAAVYKGPCHALQSALQTFFYAYKSAVQPPPGECPLETFDKLETKASEIIAHGRFIIATLPDPVHTHLSLIFDRQAEAIQQAAQDAGYTYDSSWFPWEKEGVDELALLADRDAAENRRDDREEHPGVLLFRRSVDSPGLSPDNSSPLDDFLIVFVVGEDPTGGIHRHQFENAVAWITQISLAQNLTVHPDRRVSPTQILGPSFSGSLPSLLQILSGPSMQALSAPVLDIYSGQVTSKAGVEWFQRATSAALGGSKVSFYSFQHDDESASRSFFAFLHDNRLDDESHVAIVAEDETAYGNFSNSSPDSSNSSDSPAFHFYYPRDISALRAAYQEQSLFNRPTSTADAARRTLRSDLVESDSPTHDTIRTYGRNQTALSQEAVLLQIVSMLRAHNTHFILLRSSNPLDQLFLAHFFKLSYPEGRVVTAGNDLLLRREVGAGGLNGIMTLSTYPLVPEIDDWTVRQLDNPTAPHFHRAFTQDGAQGVYVALRFLLAPVCPAAGQVPAVGPCKPGAGADPFLPLPNAVRLAVPGYAAPFWQEPRSNGPLLWLSVLGNKGFAPVAALPSTKPQASPHCLLQDVVNHLAGAPGTLIHSLCWATPTGTFRTLSQEHPRWWPKVPFSMNLALVAVFLWACFHLLCCCSPSITVKPEHRSYFVRLHATFLPPGTGQTVSAPFVPVPRSHIALIVFSSFLLAITAMVLAWSYGWMSDQGEPIQHPLPYAVFPWVISILAAAAVAGNSYIEHDLHLPGRADFRRHILARPRPWSTETWPSLRKALLPLGYFLLATAGFCVFYVLYLDSYLPSYARVLTYFRAMNLTTGVSPAVPVLLLILGMYGWAWNSLRGLGLFNAGRPRLPEDSVLEIWTGQKFERFLTMLGEAHAGRRIEALCWPFHRNTLKVAGLVFGGTAVFAPLLAGGIPLRSLGLSHYAIFICIWIAISISILLANAWQLTQLWMRLRNLLLFLDKLPLRRTMQAIRGFSWGSIWGMGGNVLDVRYKLFYRQFETLNHLQAALDSVATGEVPASIDPASARRLIGSLEASRAVRRDFAAWYARGFNRWTERDLYTLQRVQEVTAILVGNILTSLLVPTWTREKASILTEDAVAPQAHSSPPEGEDAHISHLAAALPDHIRAAEEIVCLLYLGYIQNILGRIRTLVLGIICLFLSIAFVIPSYPFDPRPLLTGAVIFLFLAVAVVIFVVYSQMFRDATLSHLTNTKPGELGADFWLKLFTFGIGPAVGLLASVFPEFSQFVLSFLGPGGAGAK